MWKFEKRISLEGVVLLLGLLGTIGYHWLNFHDQQRDTKAWRDVHDAAMADIQKRVGNVEKTQGQIVFAIGTWAKNGKIVPVEGISDPPQEGTKWTKSDSQLPKRSNRSKIRPTLTLP